MSNHPVHSRIAEARSQVHGEFASTSRVVDSLLDLRSLASPDQDLVELIDVTLASIPGRTIAPNSWWLEALDTIDRCAGAGEHGLQACEFASV